MKRNCWSPFVISYEMESSTLHIAIERLAVDIFFLVWGITRGKCICHRLYAALRDDYSEVLVTV